MDRINLGDGQWFNRKTAKRYNEDTYWDGNNWISSITRSQWSHECLYQTKGGRWILRSWSNWQGTTDNYTPICESDAHQWLVDNGHHGAVPNDVLSKGEL